MGFFDPLYKGKSSQKTEPLFTEGKDTIYRDVHVFIERLRTYNTVSKSVIRNNLRSCLRGMALSWHLTELSETEHKYLASPDEGNSIEHWIKLLSDQFKGDVGLAQ